MMGNWVISMYIIFKIYIYCRLVGMFSKQSSSTHSTAIKAIYLLQALPQSCHKAITKESQLVSHRLDNQLLTLYLVYMCWCFKQKKKEKKMELKFWACCGIAVIVLVTLVPEGWAQDSSCLNELAPCLNYLNGTRDPPDSCCDPLKSVIKSKPECLCSMISTKGTSQARQAGINVTEAQQLPGRCGQHVNPLSCLSSMHLISYSF